MKITPLEYKKLTETIQILHDLQREYALGYKVYLEDEGQVDTNFENKMVKLLKLERDLQSFADEVDVHYYNNDEKEGEDNGGSEKLSNT